MTRVHPDLVDSLDKIMNDINRELPLEKQLNRVDVSRIVARLKFGKVVVVFPKKKRGQSVADDWLRSDLF